MRLKKESKLWRILLACLVLLYVAAAIVIPVCAIKFKQEYGTFLVDLSIFKMLSIDNIGFNTQTVGYRFNAVYLLCSASSFLTGAALCSLSSKKALCDAALGSIASSFLLMLAVADSIFVVSADAVGGVTEAGISWGLAFYFALHCLSALVILRVKAHKGVILIGYKSGIKSLLKPPNFKVAANRTF